MKKYERKRRRVRKQKRKAREKPSAVVMADNDGVLRLYEFSNKNDLWAAQRTAQRKTAGLSNARDRIPIKHEIYSSLAKKVTVMQIGKFADLHNGGVA